MQRHEIVRGRLSRLLSRSGASRTAGDVSLMEQFEPRTLMDAVFWDGGAGTSSWHDAANWNRGGVDAVPVNGDDVTINVAANPTVTFSTGSLTLNSLVTNEALTVSGGTLGLTGAADVNAVMTMSGGTLSGGAWDVTGGTFRATSSGGTLTNTQITGDLLADSTSARFRIGGTTRFTAARLSANASNLDFTPGYVLMDLVVAEGAAAGTRSIQGAVGGVGTLTIGPTGVIRHAAGAGGNLTLSNSSALTLINNGLISAEASGRTFTINNTTLTNNATIQATAGTLDLTPTNFTNAGTVTANDAALKFGGAWSNTATVTITNSALELAGTFTTAGIGTINRSGGTVALSGAMDNTGATFTLNAATGSWSLFGGVITGGTLNFAAGSRLLHTSSGGNLTDVQVNGELILDTTSARVRIGGTTRFTAARLQANAANVDFAPGYTLMDLVSAEGAAAGARSIQGAVGGVGTLFIGATGVIRLAAGAGGNLTVSNSSALTLTNSGLISAEAEGRTLTVNNTNLTNLGTMQSIGGTLSIAPTSFTNSGTVSSAANATVIIAGNWLSNGTISTTNGTVELAGTFNTAGLGTFNRTGGTVNLTGTMNNAAAVVNFTAASGSWNLVGGIIMGGTLNYNGANRLAHTSSGGLLQDVQVNGDVILDTTSARVRVGGTTRFTAVRLSANAANVDFLPDYVLSDLVIAEGAAVGARSIQGAVGGTGSLTISPTGVIRLAAGSGGNLSISNSSTLTLINNGLISAEAATRTLTINNTTFTNNANAQVIAGTLNISPTNWTNAGMLTAAPVATLDLGGTWSNPGTITSTNATVNLGGTFTTLGVGSFSRVGGAVNVTGTMNNESTTFTFTAATGPWNMRGGTINGGSITFAGSDRLVTTSSGGRLNDVQVNGELLFDTTSARLTIAGTTRFVAARLAANAANIDFAPGYTLFDTVISEGAVAGGRSIQGAVGGAGTLTIAPGAVIRLAAGSGGNLTISNSSALTLINNGLISAEADGRTLTINNTNFTNNATLQALAGTASVSATTWTNSPTGTISASNAILTFSGAWSNAGNITINNATLNAGGTFTTAGFGTMTRTGGTVNLTGTMDNSSSTFTFNAGTGIWNLAGGTVLNGTIAFTGGNRLAITSSGGTLDDVQVNGELLFDVTSARVRIDGATRFAAARLASNGANLDFAPGYVLMDLVVVEGAVAGGRSIQGAVGAPGTLTIGPTGVIRLAAGSGGNLVISNSSQLTLINDGLISAEATGRTLTINNQVLTNNGTIQTLAGVLNVSPTTFTNYAKGVLTGGTFNAFGTGMLTMPAKTVIVTNNATIGVGAAGNFPAVMTLRTNNGTLQTGGGGTFSITPDGGTLTNNGTVILAPTNVLNIAGNFIMADNADMIVQIQGELPSDIGRLTVTGTATLNGDLSVVAVNGYDPDCVNQPFLTAGLRSGQFDTHTLPEPPTDHQVFVVYVGNEVRFAISPPSDFNRDGILNSQDVFDFLNAFFTTNILADFNQDGVVNSQDFFDFIADFFEGCG